MGPPPVIFPDIFSSSFLHGLHLMPPRRASSRQSMTSVARSQRAPQAPTPSSASQAPSPPTTAVDMEQSDDRPPTDFANTISGES